MKLSNVVMPTFTTGTIAGIADSLRNTGELDKVREQAKMELQAKGFFVPKVLETARSLSRDAFDLWSTYYEGYSCKYMANRVENLRYAYETYIWEGIPDSGTRLIDHGISSGLLILMADTLFYRFFFGVGDSEPKKNSEEAKVWNHIRKDIIPTEGKVLAHWWWVGVVWASAAVALHNIQQEERPWPGCIVDTNPLSLTDDPLAYLGILVDILQEWDRYRVLRRKVLSGDLPIQVKDVHIEVKNDLIVLDYREGKRTDKVKRNLDLALDQWDQIISIKG